jgi:hypothetical protein
LTAGTDAFVSESPRVAAFLNLLMPGFGYFYLGKRLLGIVVFLGLWVLQGTFSHNPQDVKDVMELWGPGFVLELVSIGLAVDAYRMAREREKQILATIQLPPRITGNFPAAIPVGLSLLLGAGYFAVADHGLYMPNYANIDQSTARVVRNRQGSIYDNPAYRMTLAVPGSWTIEHQERKSLAHAIREDHGCSADLRPYAWSFLLGLDPYKRKLDYQISQGNGLNAKILDEQPIVVSGLSGRDISLSVKRERDSIVEHRIIARRGMTLYVLTTVQLAADDATPADPSCTSDLQFIRDHLRLPH